ncbi:DUF3667 domain-containing protein [Marixanthomonas ophiurae]|uniref:DUF3667 domain-containing protein n=1 Tax=Marixanthomonas ophiurae TaxID=387659 RepID=A0A3E1QCJ6_9FLAO|nr:DUF3667 domain-containing protein [Marixanthomonas ophiurae]RFN59832.1 DUF3667 domain-containing protein [Marixanthomonas ophiurae]
MSKHKPVPSNSRKAQKYRGIECLNCGQPLDLSDIYCPYCSQLNSTKQLSFKDFFAEFINSIVSYDSRLRYTVKDLLFKPGTITRYYINGQRLKYANPFRFFLSVSIIYFILQGFIAFIVPEEDSMFNDDVGEQIEGEDFYDKFISINEQIKEASAKAKVAEDSISERKDSLLPTKNISQITYFSEESLDSLSWLKSSTERFKMYRNFYETHTIKKASVALDSLNHKNTLYNRWLYNKNESIERISNNPKGFLDYLFRKIPFFIFFFTPVYALFFWLIYSKKKHNYIDHTIFIFHVFSFLFLALIVCLLPDTILGSDFFQNILLLLIGPFYYYKALRNFYKQSRFITIVKFVFLNFIFWIGATFAAILFFAATAAIY